MKQADDNYQLYQKKEEEARITDELDENKITNVSVAEAPVQPSIPVRPNRPVNLLLGLFLGVMLSLGSVVVAEFMRDTVLTPHELEALTGRPVLASLPRNAETLATMQEADSAPSRFARPNIRREPQFEWAD